MLRSRTRTIEGAICPNCGSRSVRPLAYDHVQCTKCLKKMRLEVVIKEVY